MINNIDINVLLLIHFGYNQIVAGTDAVTLAPQQSAAQLRRKMQLAGPDSPGKNIVPECSMGFSVEWPSPRRPRYLFVGWQAT
jgi:hypothetical protein